MRPSIQRRSPSFHATFVFVFMSLPRILFYSLSSSLDASTVKNPVWMSDDKTQLKIFRETQILVVYSTHRLKWHLPLHLLLLLIFPEILSLFPEPPLFHLLLLNFPIVMSGSLDDVRCLWCLSMSSSSFSSRRPAVNAVCCWLRMKGKEKYERQQNWQQKSQEEEENTMKEWLHHYSTDIAWRSDWMLCQLIPHSEGGLQCFSNYWLQTGHNDVASGLLFFVELLDSFFFLCKFTERTSDWNGRIESMRGCRCHVWNIAQISLFGESFRESFIWLPRNGFL